MTEEEKFWANEFDTTISEMQWQKIWESVVDKFPELKAVNHENRT